MTTMEIETKGGEEEKLSTLPLEELEKKRTELTAALLKVSEEILRRKTTKNPYRLDNPINSRNVNDIHEIMEKYPNKTWERKEGNTNHSVTISNNNIIYSNNGIDRHNPDGEMAVELELTINKDNIIIKHRDLVLPESSYWYPLASLKNMIEYRIKCEEAEEKKHS